MTGAQWTLSLALLIAAVACIAPTCRDLWHWFAEAVDPDASTVLFAVCGFIFFGLAIVAAPW